jgi:ABC-type Mn2+/Zn2+ transport system permease subunit
VLAVRIGGVIPIFAYLVVPPVSAVLMTRTNTSLVLISLLVGVVGSIAGIYFSVTFDFPAGSSVVAMLGAIFAVAALVRLVRR